MAFSEVVFGSGHSWDMVVTNEGLLEIARWETYQQKRYKDASRVWTDKYGVKRAFKWTIAYGHQEEGDVEPKEIPEDMEVSKEEAWEILRADAEVKARWLRQMIKVPVTTPMFNALVALTLNVGQGNVEKGPILPFLNETKYIAACTVGFLHHTYTNRPVIDPATGEPALNKKGEPISKRAQERGLIARRMCEGAMFLTKKD